MVRADVIELVSITYKSDSVGNQIPVETRKTAYCDVYSVSQKEFYSAATQSLKPAHKFVLFAGDYSGESEIEYGGTRYPVYRTYQDGDRMELYTEERVGV